MSPIPLAFPLKITKHEVDINYLTFKMRQEK